MCLAAAACGGAAIAADIEWGGGSGVLQDPAGWVGGVVPDDGDGGLFLLPGVYTLSLVDDAEFGYLAVDGSSPIFDLGAFTLDLAFVGGSPAGVSVGESAGTMSALSLSSGTLFSDTVKVALVDGATATATVSGAGALWEIPFRADIGIGGDGALEILGGGAVEGGQVLLGRQATGSGRVTVSGDGSLLDASFLTVGEVGDGTLEIFDGGVATLSGLRVGLASGGAGVTLTGEGSEIDTPLGDAVFGDGGDATLHFEDGSLIARDIVFAKIGSDVTADCLSGSFSATRDVVVGSGGVADVTLGASHTTLCDRLRVASGNGSLATLRLEGIAIAQTRIDISPGLFSLGTLDLGSGGQIGAPEVRVFSNGVLRGEGTASGALNISGGVDPVGVLHVLGDATFAGIIGDGTLLHTADSIENTLEISGTATLTGTYRLEVAEGFTPATDQQFVALRAGSIVGDFASFILPSEDWSVEIVGSEVVATFSGSSSPADLNGDGVVDAFDLAALLAMWGACPGCDADFNGDGVVEAFDLSVVLAAWD